MKWDLRSWITAAAAFGLVGSLWAGVLIAWAIRRLARRRRVQQRVGTLPAGLAVRELSLWHDGKEVRTLVPAGPRRRRLGERIDLLFQEAGWGDSAWKIFGGVALAAIMVFLLATALSHRIEVGGFAAVGIAVAFYIYLWKRVFAQRARFDRQLIDGLELASRSLRAGHPLISSFRVIANEIPAPLGIVFDRVCQQQAVGVGLDQSLREMALSSFSSDLRFFATAVDLQLRSGGNLADMMDHLAGVIRSRMRLNRRVRVLTAQTNSSKWILVALPMVMFVVLNLISPEYMHTLYATAAGRILLMVVVISVVLGIIVMNHMAKLKY